MLFLTRDPGSSRPQLAARLLENGIGATSAYVMTSAASTARVIGTVEDLPSRRALVVHLQLQQPLGDQGLQLQAVSGRTGLRLRSAGGSDLGTGPDQRPAHDATRLPELALPAWRLPELS